MELQGYCMINPDADFSRAMGEKDQWINKPLRVMEFGVDDCVLVMNTKATEMAMFEPNEVTRKFKCSQQGKVVMPPGLDQVESMMYMNKAMSRKGGYCHIVRSLVISTSLSRGEFCDSCLWQKQ